MNPIDAHATATLRRPAVSPVPPVAAAPRHDIYLPIHKGLRSLMAAILVEVGSMDWQVPAERDATLARLDELLDLCRGHLEHENRFVHTAIEQRLPGAAAQTEADHLEHLAAIDQLRSRADAVRRASDDAAWAASLALYRDLAVFVGENFLHMQVEESRNNASLWAAYSEAEVLAIHDALVASIPPQEMSRLLQLIVPALAPVERAQMMLGMRSGMPAAAFEDVLSIARATLSERNWGKLCAALEENPGAAAH